MPSRFLRLWWAPLAIALLVPAAIVAACLINGRLIEQIAVRSYEARHIEAAQRWMSPSHNWEPPVSLKQADDDVLADGDVLAAASGWRSVALPDQRVQRMERVPALAPGPSLPEYPQVVWYRIDLPANSGSTPYDIYIPRISSSVNNTILQERG